MRQRAQGEAARAALVCSAADTFGSTLRTPPTPFVASISEKCFGKAIVAKKLNQKRIRQFATTSAVALKTSILLLILSLELPLSFEWLQAKRSIKST